MQTGWPEVGQVPRRAIVLGSTGFLGRNVCAALRAAGCTVFAVIRGAGDPPAGCRALRLQVARESPSALAAALAAVSPSLVVNAAGALWGVTDAELTEGNMTLVERLIPAIASLAGPVRLVHIGSAYEYGSQSAGVRLAESLAERPDSRYALSKFAGTRIVTEAVAAGRIDAVVLRIATAVGPWAPRQSLLGGLASQLATSPSLIELPPISGERDIIDVRDVADAVLAAAVAPTVPPIVNVGRGSVVPVRDVVDSLIRISGSSAQISWYRPPAARRDSGIGAHPMDTSLARQELGWFPTRSLLEALQALWDSVRRPDDPDAPGQSADRPRDAAYAGAGRTAPSNPISTANGDAPHG